MTDEENISEILARAKIEFSSQVANPITGGRKKLISIMNSTNSVEFEFDGNGNLVEINGKTDE